MTDSWLSLFAPPSKIRRTASIDLHATRLLRDGTPRLVITGTPTANMSLNAARFDDVARVHRLVSHPRIPVVAERGRRDGVEYLSFACGAVADGGELLRCIAAKRIKISFDAADAFISGLREALQAGHGVTDPSTGRPICAGKLCYGNVLCDRGGEYWLLALGTNLLTSLDSGAPSGELAFQAPEVGAGATASPVGDYVALRQFMRSLLPYTELPERLTKVMQGDIGPEDGDLLETVLWFEQRVMSAPAAERASMDEALAMAQRVRDILGTSLDHAGFAATIRQALGASDPQLHIVDQPTLVVAHDASWIRRPDGELVDLESHSALRRIVLALATAQGTGTVLAVSDLLKAGWPGERVSKDAGANRVYVAIATLRRLGLRGLLQKKGRGYRFSAPTSVEVGTGDKGPESGPRRA